MLCLSLGLVLAHGVERAADVLWMDSMTYQATNYRTCHFQPRSGLIGVRGK